MPTRTVIVGSAVGLHARPAQTIADAAAELKADVFVGLPDGEPVNANSAIMIMTLGAGNGATVEVSGEDAAAVDTIAALIEKDLDA
jgi:phosphocarrier protein HPr